MDGIETYDDAQRKCETDNGRLLVLTTAQQIKGAQQYLNSKGINRVLVGMTDRVTEGLWMWSDGTPFDSTMWSGLSLNNYDSAYLKEIKNADCVTLKSHSLYDVHCNATQPFMCERPQLV
ncbi:C-type lectin domain family 4 member F-like [Pecten maximus]|uniref:C-type lectin domain family 4 member F-like n=1 Tax=Pecten maximus TaxID=6579 RepID=UPI001458EDB6|nr:C-type lectin domain family 4 member F-like [Pecten maximus]